MQFCRKINAELTKGRGRWETGDYSSYVDWDKGLPRGTSGKDPTGQHWTQAMQVWSLGQEGPLGGKWQPTLVFLRGESHGQKSLAGNSP